MGTTLSDLLAILAVEVGVLYTVWAWPGRTALVRAASVSTIGCLLLTALFLALGDGLPTEDVLAVGYSLGFVASVHRSSARTSSTHSPLP